jgi:hypothetical protein
VIIFLDESLYQTEYSEIPLTPIQEEFQMTMQVGMVGTDGIILASDTKWMYTGTVRQTSSSSKIRINDKRTVAIACARNMENSVSIADNIIAELKDDKDWEYLILPIEAIARQVLSLPGDPASERNDAQCLIVSRSPNLQLFFLQIAVVNRQAGTPLCQKVKDKAVAGDNVNAAVFWSERFYKPTPIRTLAPLASHLIVAASKLNPAAIGGLEIVLCDNSGLHRLSDESVWKLDSKANELDKNLEASLLSHSLEFSYAPNVIG